MGKAPKTVEFTRPLKNPKGTTVPVYSRVGHYVEVGRGGKAPGRRTSASTPVKEVTEKSPLAIGHTPRTATGHKPLLGLPAPKPKAIGYNPARPAAGPRALPAPTRLGLPGPTRTPNRAALPGGRGVLSSSQGFAGAPRPAATGPRSVLGVSANATRAEIDKAYKSLSRQHHPDRPGGSTEKMASINAAYNALGKGN
jgi:hypothetical protein